MAVRTLVRATNEATAGHVLKRTSQEELFGQLDTVVLVYKGFHQGYSKKKSGVP
jgi:hypothetical protein